MTDQTRNTESSPAVGTVEGTPSSAAPIEPQDAQRAEPRRLHNETPIGRPGLRTRIWNKIDAFASWLSTRNNFWHRVCSLIWLPYAFRSGIRMVRKGEDEGTFACILPFRRFNKNWYNAMAGAALLANSEVAGGMYVFKKAGKDYTVVCRELNYRFLRPCFGPAVYKVVENDALDTAIAEGGEFNISITMNVFQPPQKPGDREKRVGRCVAQFHVTPKTHHQDRKLQGRPTAVR